MLHNTCGCNFSHISVPAKDVRLALLFCSSIPGLRTDGPAKTLCSSPTHSENLPALSYMHSLMLS